MLGILPNTSKGSSAQALHMHAYKYAHMHVHTTRQEVPLGCARTRYVSSSRLRSLATKVCWAGLCRCVWRKHRWPGVGRILNQNSSSKCKAERFCLRLGTHAWHEHVWPGVGSVSN